MTIEKKGGKLKSDQIEESLKKLDASHERNMDELKKEIEALKKNVEKEQKKAPAKKKTTTTKTTPTVEPGEAAPSRIDAAVIEKLKADLDIARSAWLTAEFKYKNEKTKIGKLMTYLVGDKSKIANSKFGKKQGIDSEKYAPVEKAQDAYNKRYMEYRVARNTDRKAELYGRPEDEIKRELKKMGHEDSDAEYNEVQAERGNNIIASTPEKSNKRSELLGKALTIGKGGALAVWGATKAVVGGVGYVYNKTVDKIDGGRSVTFKIPWGKDENGEKKYLEHKHRIGKLVISTAIAGLTVGGPEMWIRIARSLTIAVGSGFGLNYATKKHEAKMAVLAQELADIEAKSLDGTMNTTQYAEAKRANEDAVRSSNKRYNLTCYLLVGGAIGANIGSAYGLEQPGQLLGGAAEKTDTVTNLHVNDSPIDPHKPVDLTKTDFLKGGFRPEQTTDVEIPLRAGIHVEDSPLDPNKPADLTKTDFLKGYFDQEHSSDVEIPLRKDGVEASSLMEKLKASGIVDNDSTQVADTTGMKPPVFVPGAPTDSSSLDTNVFKNPIINPVAPVDTNSVDTNALKNPIFVPTAPVDSTNVTDSLNQAPSAPVAAPVPVGTTPNAATTVPSTPGIHKAFETKISSTGIGTNILEIKKAIHEAYPGDLLKTAPASLQHIAETPIYELAKEWHAFDPSVAKESMNAFGTIDVNMDTGTVTVHDVLTDTNTVVAGEHSVDWKGGMIDSDHSGVASGAAGPASNGTFNISHIPDGAQGPDGTFPVGPIPEGQEGAFDISHNPETGNTVGQNPIDTPPGSGATPQELQDWAKNHPGRVLIDPISGKVVDPETGRPYSDAMLDKNATATAAQKAAGTAVEAPKAPVETAHPKVSIRGDAYEDRNGTIVRLQGKAVTFDDHKILVDGKEAPELTEKYELERTKTVEKIGPTFSWSGNAEKSAEWANIHSKDVHALVTPSDAIHSTFEGNEEKYIKKLIKVARDVGIDTATFTGTADQLVEEIALRKLD